MKWLFNCLIIFFFFVLHLSLKNYFFGGNFFPLFNMIGVILFVLFFEFKDSFIFSFISGFLLDVFSLFFGLHLIFFLFLSFTIYFLKKEWLKGEGLSVVLFLVWVSTILYYLILFIILKNFSLNIFFDFNLFKAFIFSLFDFHFLKILIFSLLLNGFFTILIFYPSLKWRDFLFSFKET